VQSPADEKQLECGYLPRNWLWQLTHIDVICPKKTAAFGRRCPDFVAPVARSLSISSATTFKLRELDSRWLA
jgi:hypothetical protein